MPIRCPMPLAPLEKEEFVKLDYAVTGYAFDTHLEIGRLADESVYRNDLMARLAEAGFCCHREIPVEISFEGFFKTYFLDLVVDPGAVYEMKAVRKLNRDHEGQLLNYLFLTEVRRGKLINFGGQSVETRFVNAPTNLEERRAFRVEDHRWQGYDAETERILELVSDWGTGLEISLYFQALIHLFGGDSKVGRVIQLKRGTIELGSHRFDVLGGEIPFRLTAFPVPQRSYEDQLRRLLALTPFRMIHWINLCPGCVSFATIHV